MWLPIIYCVASAAIPCFFQSGGGQWVQTPTLTETACVASAESAARDWYIQSGLAVKYAFSCRYDAAVQRVR
jgi:hypothetical protein